MAVDKIHISDLSLHVPDGLGPSAFNLLPAPPCPANLSLTVSLRSDVIPSCVGNDTQGGLGVDYSSLSRDIQRLSSEAKWDGPHELLEAIGKKVLENEVVKGVQAVLELPRASLIAQSIIYSTTFTSPLSRPAPSKRDLRPEASGNRWKCRVKGVRCMTIIGLRDYERKEKQWLEVDVTVEDYEQASWDHLSVTKSVHQWLEQSSYGTIEALIDDLAFHLLSETPALQSPQSGISIHLKKPSALALAVPGITIERTMQDYTNRASSSTLINADNIASAAAASYSTRTTEQGPRQIFIALGSNLGDRISNINRATDELGYRGIQVVRHSRLYESEPMYHEDQGKFINGVIEARTDLSPMQVVRTLKAIEREIGRTKTFRNGPRTLDLDLLLFGDDVVKIDEEGSEEDEHGIGWLETPHPRIAEREFVLRPLADIAPSLLVPGQTQSVARLLSTLMQASKSTLAPIIPLPSPARPIRLGRAPQVMQIFNATPDSFSDGSISSTDPESALESISKLFDIAFPPEILDIGGQSTRPGAEMIDEDEEIARVVPLIRSMRSSDNPRINSIPISIDTFRPNVAQLAIDAGASIINDVRGGSEPGMLEVMARLNVPVILMHSRGDSTSMLTPESKDYSTLGGVVKGVQTELGQRVQRALDAGVKGWNIILDPGLGFAKGTQDNLNVLRHLPNLLAPGSPLAGYPMLIGGSRKRFVGEVTKQNVPTDRLFGDVAVVGWCMSSGVVDIVRVHEGRGMQEMVNMWRAISDAESQTV